MRKGAKKICILIAALIAAVTLTGCGAGLECAYYSDGSSYYYDLSISISLDKMTKMERTAAYNPAAYDKWTFSDYVYGLSQRLTFNDGSRFNFVSEGNREGYHIINLSRKVLASQVQGGTAEDENYDVKRKNLFFLYETTVTVSHPFNDMRTLYDDAQLAHSDIMSIIKYGIKSIGSNGEIISAYPSVFEAFPSLKGSDVGGFTMAYLIPASKSGSSTGETVYIDGVKFFRFDRVFDTTQETITYRYYSANTVGWYITAIGAGVLVTALILLFTKKKKDKSKPQLAELFPYDPFAEQSADNLPAGYNADDNKKDGFKY